jgi:hypothetical protein
MDELAKRSGAAPSISARYEDDAKFKDEPNYDNRYVIHNSSPISTFIIVNVLNSYLQSLLLANSKPLNFTI